MAVTPALSTEVLTDPLVRGYAGMTDAQVLADMKLVIRDGPADAGALFNYLVKETAKDHSSEPVASTILGRIYKVIEAGTAGIGTEVFVGSETPGPFANLQAEGLDACYALRDMALGDRLGSFAESTTEQKIQDLLNVVKDTGVMKPADVTAIVGLSQNKQSRIEELNLGNVREGDIAKVRA